MLIVLCAVFQSFSYTVTFLHIFAQFEIASVPASTPRSPGSDSPEAERSRLAARVMLGERSALEACRTSPRRTLLSFGLPQLPSPEFSIGRSAPNTVKTCCKYPSQFKLQYV